MQQEVAGLYGFEESVLTNQDFAGSVPATWG
jgi:hypothetical protein